MEPLFTFPLPAGNRLGSAVITGTGYRHVAVIEYLFTFHSPVIRYPTTGQKLYRNYHTAQNRNSTKGVLLLPTFRFALLSHLCVFEVLNNNDVTFRFVSSAFLSDFSLGYLLATYVIARFHK